MNRLLLLLTLFAMSVVIWALQPQPARTAAPTVALAVSFSEIAPVAGDTGQAAWVELKVSDLSAAHSLYLPAVRVAAGSNPAATEPVPSPRGDKMVDLTGWHLSDHDGNRYDFPSGLLVPEATMLVVRFATGVDDTNPADGVVTLYASDWGSTPFAAEGDDLTLYNQVIAAPDAVADYIAWGQSPGTDAEDAIAAGKWVDGAYHFFDAGFGAEGYPSPVRVNDSLGYRAGNWFPYYATYSTPGEPNPLPRPTEWLTPDGSTLERDTFHLAWSPLEIEAVRYDFQFATTNTFDSPLVNTTLELSSWQPAAPLSDGTYYWRARVRLPDGTVGDWWGPFSADSLTLDFSAGVLRTTMAPEFYQIQHKDTALLEIGGGPGNQWWDEEAQKLQQKGLWREQTLNGMPAYRDVWDAAHVFQNGNRSYNNGNSFDNYYCARATSSMMNHFYGGTLSQDRISYHIFEEDADNEYTDRPEGDFGFRRGASLTTGMEFALGIEMDAHHFCPDPDGTYNGDDSVRCALSPVPDEPVTLTWEEITSELDKGEPLAFSSSKHAFIISGYWEFQGKNWVQLFDPAPKTCTEEKCGSPTWREWDGLAPFLVTYLTVPDGVTPQPRHDESALHQDSDEDGVMDFDEIVRFNTDPFTVDTDEDWLNDKQEMASYTFTANGKYLRPWGDDFDHDGVRMEHDWDNDADQVADGCEDRNGNSYYDSNSGETSNFNDNYANICIPRLTLRAPTTAAPANAGTYANPSNISVVVDVNYPVPMGVPNYQQNAFSVTIGGEPATVLAKSQVGAQVTLTVRPPAQPAPGLRDISVRYNSPAGPQTASAASAVQYDPVPQ
jgi:hypothetical protein